jgi:fatty acid desaturase
VRGGVPSGATSLTRLVRENAVATDLHVTGSDTVEVPARTHRRRAVLLLGLALFQFWLWGTRVVNLLEEVGSFSAAFVAVHLVLYVAAIGAGVLLAVLGVRMWRESRSGTRT